MRKRMLIPLLLTLSLAVAATGCGKDGGKKTVTDDDIKNIFNPGTTRTTEGGMGGDVNSPHVDIGTEVNIGDEWGYEEEVTLEPTEEDVTTEARSVTEEQPTTEEPPAAEPVKLPIQGSVCVVYPGIIGGNANTFFIIREDGSFEYHYEDRGQAEDSDGYFSRWYAGCNGRFGEITQTGDFSYTLKITELEEAPLKEPVIDGDRKISNEPTGLTVGQTFEFYTAGYPVKDLPEGFMASSDFIEISGNKLTGCAFYDPSKWDNRGQAFMEEKNVPELMFTPQNH